MRRVRGSLPGKLSLVATLTENRLRLLNQKLDEMNDASEGTTFGGHSITRRDHLALLARDPDYQARQLSRVPYASAQERERLQRDIARAGQLYPATVPPEVGQPPRLGIPELDQGV